MSAPILRPFHLAFPVDDLEAARRFYVDVLECTLGRESATNIDFDFRGHQLVAHLRDQKSVDVARNPVDGDSVPIPHFGLVLEWDDWEALADRLRAGGHEFLVEPRIRFEGEVGEQGTFFARDPAGNALEFKTFRDLSRMFSR